MRVLLLFPPQYEPTQPYSSLPCLTAVLRKSGINVIQRDINLESFYYLLNEQFLKQCAQKLINRIAHLENTEFLDIGNQKNYLLAIKAVASVEYVIANINNAIENVKQYESFRKFEVYNKAISIIKCALKIISAAYYPSRIELYETRIGENPDSSVDALRAAVDPDINPYVEWLEQKILPDLIAYDAKIVGISLVCHDQFVPALSIATLLKKYSPDKIILFGGPYITRIINYLSNPQDFFNYVDGVITGEGETAILEIVDRLNNGDDLSGVKNLIVFRDGQIICGEKYTEPFESLPLPDFNGLPLDRYFSPFLILPFTTSRGCYYSKCTFCCHFHPINLYRGLNPDNAYEKIKELSDRYDTKYFSFSDNAIPAVWLKQFSECTLKNNDNIAWFTFARLEDEFQKSVIKTIAKGGCKILMFGLESSEERIQSLMEKGINTTVVKRILSDCAESGISIRLGTLIGFPSETREESFATINFFKQNKDLLDNPFFASPTSRFKLLRDSIVDYEPDRFGVKIKEHPLDEDLEREQHYVTEHGMSMEESEEQYRKYIEFFVHNFHAYKQMPDNKAHSFLYKCFSDEGKLIPWELSHSMISSLPGISPLEWIGNIELSQTVIEIETAFDLECIVKNTEWLDREIVFGRLREGKSHYNIKHQIIKIDTTRKVYRNQKTYLFDVLTHKAMVLETPIQWIANNLNKYTHWTIMQKDFMQTFGWALKDDDIKSVLIQFDRQKFLQLCENKHDQGCDPI